jgi:hypothetical protein
MVRAQEQCESETPVLLGVDDVDCTDHHLHEIDLTALYMLPSSLLHLTHLALYDLDTFANIDL